VDSVFLPDHEASLPSWVAEITGLVGRSRDLIHERHGKALGALHLNPAARIGPINVRSTAAEPATKRRNGMMAPELAARFARVKAQSRRRRVGNGCRSARSKRLLNAQDVDSRRDCATA